MSEWVQTNATRDIAVYLQRRESSDPACVVYGTAGESLATPTATRDSVDTTLSAGVVVGAQSLTLTSASGVTVGRRYLVGGPEDEGGESVTVKAVSGTTITLVRPLLSARASGVTFVSTRVTLTLPAIATVARGYRVEIASTPVVTVPFDVTRYALHSSLSIEDVRDLDPAFTKRIPAGTWMPGLIVQAWAIILRRVATKRDPGACQGLIDLTTAHGYLVRELLAESAGNDFEQYRALMATRAEQELEASLATAKWDGPTPGVADSAAQWRRGITMVRA